MLAGMAVNFGVIWKHGLAVALFNPADLTAPMYFMNKPYTKIHAIAIGIGFAFIFEELNDQKNFGQYTGALRLIKSHKLLVTILWLVSMTLIGFISLYPVQAMREPMLWTTFENSLYIAFSRPLFLLSVFFIVL
jgi:hypothetical protein